MIKYAWQQRERERERKRYTELSRDISILCIFYINGSLLQNSVKNDDFRLTSQCHVSHDFINIQKYL